MIPVIRGRLSTVACLAAATALFAGAGPGRAQAATAAPAPARAATPAQPATPAQAPAQRTGPIRIDAGAIQGLVDSTGVREFRGVPYAAPPVGALRWKPPQPVAAWSGVRDATTFGARCMQLPVFGDMVFRSNGMGEDCLYLNVWTPVAATAPKAARLPVLVYFFGGGFVAGDGSEPRYDGGSLARSGIVVVTVNYRLGVFGFLALPELTKESPHHASGDYGLLDQVAALHWVRRNIAAFGGDPRRVTIAGESAGSISVSALMASPLSRKLVAGAIGESGAMIEPTFAPVPLAAAEKDGESFATRVGATSLAGLRALPADSLLRITALRSVPRFRVTLDGWFLPKSPAEIFAAGKQARVPLLVGWNSEESSWRALLRGDDPTPEAYAAVLRDRYGDRAGEALRAFPGADTTQVRASATALAGASFIAFSTWKWAELQARTGRHPVYRYYYAHPRPATVAPSSREPPSGAVHSAEIEYALGNLGTNRVYAWTPEDYRLSGLLEAYFANFVKTGDPNGPGLPRWPATASGDSTQLLVIDTDAHAAPQPYAEGFRFLDRFYSAGPRP